MSLEKRTIKKHNVQLASNFKDINVYLVCSCGWECSLGDDSSPQDALNCEKEHILSALEAAFAYTEIGGSD